MTSAAASTSLLLYSACCLSKASLRADRSDSKDNHGLSLVGERMIAECNLSRESTKDIRKALAPGRKRARSQRNRQQSQAISDTGNDSLAMVRGSALRKCLSTMKSGNNSILKARTIIYHCVLLPLCSQRAFYGALIAEQS